MQRRYIFNAVIYVERDSQKGIIIGKQGKALKKVATEARTRSGTFLRKNCFPGDVCESGQGLAQFRQGVAEFWLSVGLKKENSYDCDSRKNKVCKLWEI